MKVRILLNLDEKTREELLKMAKEENRTLTNLINTILIRAVKDRTDGKGF